MSLASYQLLHPAIKNDEQNSSKTIKRSIAFVALNQLRE